MRMRKHACFGKYLLMIFYMLLAGILPTSHMRASASAMPLQQSIDVELPRMVFGTDASLAVAPDGSVHIAFSPKGPAPSKAYPVQYAVCKTQCDQKRNWSVTAFGDVGMDGGKVRLRLNSQGYPRLMWYYRDFSADNGVYVYAECNQNCLKPNNWSALVLGSSRQYSLSDEEYFVLDASGRPHFFFQDPAYVASYASCQRACTQVANWTTTALAVPDIEPYHFQVAIDGQGHLRVSFLTAPRVAETYVGFAACDRNCTTASQWVVLPHLLHVGSVDYDHSLAVNSQGHPRLAIYTGGYADGPTQYDYRLLYLWCDTQCADIARWSYTEVPVPANYGENVQLLLDQQGQPRMVYYVKNGDLDNGAGHFYGMGQAWCSANCTINGARWKSGYLLPREFLDMVDRLGGCAWLYVGQHPSFAVDSAGKLHVAYDAEVICSEGSAGRRIRYAIFG